VLVDVLLVLDELVLELLLQADALLAGLLDRHSLAYSFISGYFDQQNFPFMPNSSLQRQVVIERLLLGQLHNHDYQQDHLQYADHRPEPHPSAHPPIYPFAWFIIEPLSLRHDRPTIGQTRT
jgi:hypothetical protein